MFERVYFYAHVEYKLTVDCVQVENRLAFATVVATKTEHWILNSNPSTRFHYKTFLVLVPFPLVTTFEMAGTYKKWLWPNSAHITFTWHVLLLWHTYHHTYILLVMCSVSTNGERAGLANSKLTIDSLLECS